MNMSRWQAYTVDERMEMLAKLGVEVRNHQMPLPQYLRLHPDAKLTNEDVQQLYQWAHAERRRLKTLADPVRKFPTD